MNPYKHTLVLFDLNKNKTKKEEKKTEEEKGEVRWEKRDKL